MSVAGVIGSGTLGPGVGGGNILPEPVGSNPIPSGAIVNRVANTNTMNGGTSNILPQAANNPIPIYGFSVIAILFPTAAGGSYGFPI